MANNVYRSAILKLTNGSLDWDNGAHTYKAVLIDTADYSPDFNAHDFLDDVPSAARVGTPQTIANRAFVLAAGEVRYDGDDVTFTAVSGDPVEKVLVYRDSGVESTSELIALLDLVYNPSGVDLLVRWHAEGIFKVTV